jgi:4-hydroxythreonine-4-phosphate dehydrogenase
VRIGVTLGDPTGIGPELVAVALARDPRDLVVYGDAEILARGASAMGVALPPHELVGAEVDPRDAGRAQVAWLEHAVEDARNGELDALVTAPIHKAACLAAGFRFPGHTELLAARLGGGAPVTMMFVGPKLRVSLATIHVALAEVPRVLTTDGIVRAIGHTAEALVHDFGIARPRVAVAGLNPHAGEQGHFGDEETRLVSPAIAAARMQFPAAEITGPHVPDAVFRAHLDGKHDAVVALYHDQGLIPVKLVDFEDAVNCTLGLWAAGRPFVRTSPDHGVAHDIAFTGRARPTSFLAAVRLAREMLAARRR